MEQEVQGLVADALDGGMCVRSFGLTLAHGLARRVKKSGPLPLACRAHQPY